MAAKTPKFWTPRRKLITRRALVTGLAVSLATPAIARPGFLTRMRSAFDDSLNPGFGVVPGGGGGGGSAGVADLLQLVVGMAPNSYKKLNAVSEETILANRPALTQANYDGLGVGAGMTWNSDAAVALTAPSGGVSCNGLTTGMRSFSGCAISEIDGMIFSFGGGHTDSGEGPFMVFNPNKAAHAINLATGAGLWDLEQPPGRYLDVHRSAKPAGSSQTTVTDPGSNNVAYYVTTNKNGIMMPMVGHCYHGLTYFPGTSWVLISNNFGFHPTAATSIGACWLYNTSTHVLVGPITPINNDAGDGIIAGTFGYAQNSAGGPSGAPGAVVGYAPDNAAYAAFSGSFGYGIVKITDPLNLTTGIAFDLAPTSSDTQVPFEQNSTPWGAQGSMAVLADPANSGKSIVFSHGQNAATGAYADNTFALGRSLQGAPVTAELASHTYASGTVTTQGNPTTLSHCMDTSRNKIGLFDGTQVIRVTPAVLNTGWSIAKIDTGATGDIPTLHASITNVPTMNYVPAVDAYICENMGPVWVYKPSDWVHP